MHAVLCLPAPGGCDFRRRRRSTGCNGRDDANFAADHGPGWVQQPDDGEPAGRQVGDHRHLRHEPDTGGVWVAGLQKALNTQFGDRAKVINSGMSGCNSADGVRELDYRVLRNKPDMVFIEFAINDCVLRFNISQEAARKNLETMIDRILAANPQADIVLMTMNLPVGGEFTGKRTEFVAYYEMYRQVARERRLFLIDNCVNWKYLQDENLAKYSYTWVRDGVHPTGEAQLKVTLPAILAALALEPPAGATQAENARPGPTTEKSGS